MAYSLCDNIATHGPFNQYVFMGCSVESFSSSLGLNEQQGELSINLVQDCAVVPEGGNPKIVYDANLNGSYYYGADPGFINPGVGSPVYFRFGGMEFGGLLQSWTKKESPDGRPRYSVRIVDPRQILEGTQLIINNYSGGVGSCYNLINVFGFMERFGATAVCIPQPFEPTCSDTFGSALGFGGADINGEGMAWNRIKLGASVLTGAFPSISNLYSPFGRLVFKGAKTWGYGVLAPDATDINIYNNFSSGAIEIGAAYHDGNIAYYALDLSELPAMPDYFRLSGDSISVMEAINQVCDAASCDYYIELLYVPNGINVIKLIKVRTINRAAQPLLQSLDTYVNANQTIDFSIGNELRNETTTVFISGALKESFYEVDIGAWDTDLKEFPDLTLDPPQECLEDFTEATKDDKISPFVGLDANGNAILADEITIGGKTWNLWRGFDVRGLKLTLEGDFGTADSIEIVEMEILSAIGGKDAWMAYITSVKTDSYNLIDVNNEFNRENVLGDVGLSLVGEEARRFNPWATVRLRQDMPTAEESARLKELERNFDKMFAYISQIASDYGIKWMVLAPNTCVRRDSNTGEFIFSETPTSSAWTDDTDILGVPNPSSYLDVFSTEDGKIECFVKYSDRFDELDIESIPSDQFIKNNNDIYLKASAQEGFVFANLATLCSPRIIVTLSTRVKRKENNPLIRNAAIKAFTLAVEQKLDRELTDKEIINLQAKLGRKLSLPAADRYFLFDAIAIPMRSNINRYGPWITAGPPGQIRFEINDDLAPWNYGGSPAMCLAGQTLADEGVSFQQAVESGSVTVPGYPVYNGGSEFGSVIGGKNLVENRTINTEGFSETAVGESENTNIDYISVPSEQGGAWSGQYGPIITDINVDVGQQGIQTTYSFRTYTSKSGKLNKINAERIKLIGKFRYKAQKQLNALNTLKDLERKNKKRGIKEAK